MVNHRCDGHAEDGFPCRQDATWQVKRQDRAFLWLHACGAHLDEICTEQERGETVELMVWRIQSNA